MNNEYEIISHNRIKYLKLFIVNIHYRNSHIHNDFELCLVLRGHLSVHSNRESYHFHKGDLILFNPFQPHELHKTDDHALLLSLQISHKYCSSFFPNITKLQFQHTKLSAILEQEQASELQNVLLDLARSYYEKPYSYEFKCFSLVNELFFKLLQCIPHSFISEDQRDKEVARFNRINRILRHIDENYSSKLLLSDIAQAENLSLTYISHFFKAQLNVSFQEYLNQIRFNKAKQLVEQTDMKLIDICMEAGFSDTRYLNQMFNKMLGCPPNQYRKIALPQAAHNEQLYTQSIQTFITDKESLVILDQYDNH